MCDDRDDVRHGWNIFAKLEHFHPGDDAVNCEYIRELADPKRCVFVAVER